MTPTADRLLSLLSRFPKKHVLVLGDLMQDHFIRGKVSRISPEAPVPVVAVTDESDMPGGAGNVCTNLRSLGASVSVLSTIGGDETGRELTGDLEKLGICVDGVIVDPDRVTTQKCRIVAEHQQVVRFDRETPSKLSARSQTALLDQLGRALRRGADALIISDYGKGIVTGAVVRKALLAAHRTRIPVLVDPKVEHFLTYRGVDCITPNVHEAWAGMRLQRIPGTEAVESLGTRIMRRLHLKSLLVTRGENGMSIFQTAPRTKRRTSGIRVRHIPTEAREVYDVTGAGDTVISAMALGLAGKASSFEAAVLANLAAGIVVGKLGTATATVKELKEAIGERKRRGR